MRCPAAVVAIPLLCGSATGLLLIDSSEPSLALTAALAAVLTLISALGFFGDDFTSATVVAVVAGTFLTGLSLGLSGARAAYRPDLLVWFDARDPGTRDTPVVVEGVLREDASPGPVGVSLTMEVHRLSAASAETIRYTTGGLRLTVGGASPAVHADDWRAGRLIRVPTLLRRPVAYQDPGVPDDVRGLARHGVVLLGSVKSAALVEVRGRGTAVEEAASSVRRWCRIGLARHVGRWSAESGAIAAAILIGDRTGIADEDERRLQEAGTYHVIAISGGNIAILAGLVLVLLRAVRVRPDLAAAIAIGALLFYGGIAGGGASVSRAVTAACLYLGGRVMDHRGPALNALAVAGAAGVALSPVAILDGGFILSFGATLGILLGTARFAKHDGDAPALRSTRHQPGAWSRLAGRAARAARAMVTATLCAEVALAPVSALLFSRITLAGLVFNFLAIPLMTVAQVGAMATLVSAWPASPLADSAGYVTHLAATALVRSAAVVDLFPWISRDVAPPAWWFVCAYYACVVALLTRRHSRIGLVGVTSALALMIAGPAAIAKSDVPPPAPGMLRIVFLDVGQGDATMVRTPDGRVVLVDAGGLPGSSLDVGERILRPTLRALGVRSVDTLVLTHGDPDHVGGAPAVMRRFRPRAIWEGVPVPAHVALRDLAARALAAGVSWRTVQPGDRETAGRAEIRVLHPPPPEWERQRVRNEDSVVLELRYGRVSIVLPGDIGRETEPLVAARLETGRITIVKAPHHGSATSSTEPFVAAVHPVAVVFSAGKNNRFRHPAAVVVERYRAIGSFIFRTDEDGAIVLDTDGRQVQLTTRSGRRVTLLR